jgi:hypothetical protein
VAEHVQQQRCAAGAPRRRFQRLQGSAAIALTLEAVVDADVVQVRQKRIQALLHVQPRRADPLTRGLIDEHELPPFRRPRFAGQQFRHHLSCQVLGLLLPLLAGANLVACVPNRGAAKRRGVTVVAHRRQPKLATGAPGHRGISAQPDLGTRPSK